MKLGLVYYYFKVMNDSSYYLLNFYVIGSKKCFIIFILLNYLGSLVLEDKVE